MELVLFTNGLNLCSIVGDWRCEMRRVHFGSTEYVSGWVNLRTEGLVPNIRLPTHVYPISYDLSIIAVLEPDYKIDGSFSIDCEVAVGSNDGSLTLSIKYISIVEDSVRVSTDEGTT